MFHVDKRCATVSKTIAAALSGAFKEAEGEVRLSGISTPILEKVIQYFHYKLKYSNSRVPPPDFDIKPEYANELLIAANYLDC